MHEGINTGDWVQVESIKAVWHLAEVVGRNTKFLILKYTHGIWGRYGHFETYGVTQDAVPWRESLSVRKRK